VADYRLLITASATKEFDAVGTKKDRQRIVTRIRARGRDPRPAGCQRLTAREQYRVRQDPYRIVDEVDDAGSIVTIIRIGHRKGTYR